MGAAYIGGCAITIQLSLTNFIFEIDFNSDSLASTVLIDLVVQLLVRHLHQFFF